MNDHNDELPVGFLAQSVEQCTDTAEYTVKIARLTGEEIREVGFLIVKQILLVSTVGNVLKTVWRI